VQQFRGRLVFKAHRLLYHSTLGLRVIKKKKRDALKCKCVPKFKKVYTRTGNYPEVMTSAD